MTRWYRAAASIFSAFSGQATSVSHQTFSAYLVFLPAAVARGRPIEDCVEATLNQLKERGQAGMIWNGKLFPSQQQHEEGIHRQSMKNTDKGRQRMERSRKKMLIWCSDYWSVSKQKISLPSPGSHFYHRTSGDFSSFACLLSRPFPPLPSSHRAGRNAVQCFIVSQVELRITGALWEKMWNPGTLSLALCRLVLVCLIRFSSSFERHGLTFEMSSPRSIKGDCWRARLILRIVLIDLSSHHHQTDSVSIASRHLVFAAFSPLNVWFHAHADNQIAAKRGRVPHLF